MNESDELTSLKFVPDREGIDPDRVPTRRLNNGNIIPSIGLGTFGSDHVGHVEVAKAVLGAAEVGYRHFDCASVYGNEKEIGIVLDKVQQGGVPREELWITSKLWNDKHKPEEVIPQCKATLADLRLDYLDLYLIHWPFPNFHPPGCDPNYRNPEATGYIHGNYMKTWYEMEKLVDLGLVKNIGVSNMTIPKMDLLLRDANIKPVCNEMELHPHFQQPEFFKYLTERDILPIGYSPIGSPKRPERDRMDDDTAPIRDPVIMKIAESHDVHPAIICIKWAVQRGQVPIPFTTKRRKYLSNLRAVVEDPLSPGEMEEIAEIDRNCRLIKGVVFLWKDNQSWDELWDVDGEITPP